MGFKNIGQTELRIKQGPSFLGIPIKVVGKTQKVEEITHKKVQESISSIDTISSVLIENEEVLESYISHNGEVKSLEGYGNISIFNNSNKDRIWDSRIIISGTEFNSLESVNKMNLKIFEPKTIRNIKYNIINASELTEILDIQEYIEILDDKGRSYNSDKENTNQINFLLQFGKENQVHFNISLKNRSKVKVSKVNLKKVISKSFYGLRFENDLDKNIKIKGNTIDWMLNEMSPGEEKNLIINAKIHPKTQENVRTGKIDVAYTLKDHVISGAKVDDFSAYSHAMHAIDKFEIDETPDNWKCSLNFNNRSSFPMKLKSILITDKDVSTKFIDINLNSPDKETIIEPGEKYTSDSWTVIDENEPRFSRKLDYSILHKLEEITDVIIRIDDEIFKITGLQVKKEMSERQIKSFEESAIHIAIKLENMGTIPLKGILIKETIPEDFLPPQNISDYSFTNSKGPINSEDFNLKIDPPDEDSSKSHVVEITNKSQVKDIISSNDFIEMKYTFNAISPDNKKDYKFPLEVKSFYHKYQGQEDLKDFKFEDQADLQVYYVKEDTISKEKEAPSLKIAHKRRKASIGKEIFPGRKHDEFAIVIHIKNKSNVLLENLEITDTFPQSFELISSNLENKITKNNKESTNLIGFTIASILPYQEQEVMYYLKNISGKEIKFSELESYFYG